jgi:hypothetical protein
MKHFAPVMTLAVLLLSACASVPEGERMNWGYAEPSSLEGPKLAFGVDGTDYLAIMLMCDPATGVIKFDVPVAEGQAGSAVRLRSGNAVRRYEPFVPQEADGYDVAHFETDRADLVLKAFTKSGRLAVDAYGGFVPHDVKTAPERDAVASFAKACGLR